MFLGDCYTVSSIRRHKSWATDKDSRAPAGIWLSGTYPASHQELPSLRRLQHLSSETKGCLEGNAWGTLRGVGCFSSPPSTPGTPTSQGHDGSYFCSSQASPGAPTPQDHDSTRPNQRQSSCSPTQKGLSLVLRGMQGLSHEKLDSLPSSFLPRGLKALGRSVHAVPYLAIGTYAKLYPVCWTTRSWKGKWEGRGEGVGGVAKG